MKNAAFPPLPQPALNIADQSVVYPVSRIFCVGRNYAAHAAEMGNEVDREAPFYFTKSCHALWTGAQMSYPPGTANLHHEVELVVAIGDTGTRIAPKDAMGFVYGYAVGLDMTRRDLQGAAKDKRRPWDTGKDFAQSAIIGDLSLASDVQLANATISLKLNDALRQSAPLSDMVWSVAELVAHLSTLYTLAPGDLIMTGTPAGVGPVEKQDRLDCDITGLSPISVEIV